MNEYFTAHDLTLARHQGADCLCAWITQWLYWVGIRLQVLLYCSSCLQCWLVHLCSSKSGLLQSLPIGAIPFKWIGIETVGLLLPASICHQYILVAIDYTIQYLEEIPLRTIWAATVAQELAILFSRVEFPRQVFTDH